MKQKNQKNNMLEIKNQAPNFNAKTASQKTISLSDLKGKNVVLYFYPKDNTPGCTIQAQDFSNNAKEFEKLDCIILGVSRDSFESHCNFIKKFDINFELLLDEEGVLCKNYGVLKEKSTFGKKYIGIERTTFLIDKIGKIAKIWRNVSVKGHIDEVLEELKKL
jgi:thioredoxin-dependent peroxiredoxin